MAANTVATNAVARPPAPNPLATLQGLLDKYKGQIAVALPKHITPERMIRVALTAVSQSPKLQECDPLSICGAIVQASILGLEPSSVLGECFLVPFWNKKANSNKGRMEAQLIIGYHGKIKLVSNTGQLLGVKAAPVHLNDEFDFDDGIDPFVRHKYFHIPDRGPVIGYWAGAKLKNGFTSIVFRTVKEMEQHRDAFAMTRTKEGKVFGVWADNFEAMSLKTVINICLKYVPKSAQAQTAWNLDERAEAGLAQNFSVDVPLELRPVIEEPEAAAPETQQVIQTPRRISQVDVDKAVGTRLDVPDPAVERFVALEAQFGARFHQQLASLGYLSIDEIPRAEGNAIYGALVKELGD